MFAKTGLQRNLILSIGLAFALLVPVCVGAGDLTISRVSAVLIISVLSVCSGQLISSAVRLPHETGFLSAFIIISGFTALSILHLAATTTFNLDAGGAIIVDAVMVCVFYLVIRNRDPLKLYSESSAVQQDGFTLWSIVVDVSILLLISALVTIWAREALASVREAQTTGVFRVWSDFFIFAAEISHLENYPSFARQSLYLADVPQIFYHRASFALPAVYSWISSDTALQTATYLWMPTGIILMGMATYGFGCALAGRAAGICSVAALFMLPDASMYGLKNGVFAFHWLIQVVPGSGYAISIALVALSVYSLGVKSSRYSYVLVGFLLVLTSTLFRTHIAIPMIALFVILALVAWQPAKSIYRTLTIAILLLFSLLIIIIFEQITLAPHFLSGQRDWFRYIEAVLGATPKAYGIYAKLTAGTHTMWKGVVGYAMMLPAEYGAILPVILVLIFLKRCRSSILWRLDLIPFFLLAVHTAIVFLMPTPRHGDITDWSHRSFALVYVVLLIFTVSWIVWYCNNPNFRYIRIRVLGCFLGVVVISAGITTPWHYGKSIQSGSISSGANACNNVISGDIFKATRYIQEHSHSGEKILASDNDPKGLTIALTGLQSYVSLIPYFQTMGGKFGEVATARSAANEELRKILVFEDLATFGKRNKVQWYLLRHEDMPAWPPKLLDHAVFTSGSVYVFELL